MKHALTLLALLLITSTATIAQTIQNLWITGTAVPGGIQQLVRFPSGQFKFAGELLPGELKVMTTPEPVAETQYLAPRYYQSYIVNHGLTYKQTKNADDPGWIVTFAETRYRFTVNTTSHTLTGELFQPWDELFLVGGCVSCGWESYIMLPFERLDDGLCRWTWTGELKSRSENVEPRRFKIMGQNAWEPKHLHPFTQDEAPLTSTQLCTGGADNKWQIERDGRYRLTVDVFHETFHAEYLGSTLPPHDVTTAEAEEAGDDFQIAIQGRQIILTQPAGREARLLGAQGVTLAVSHSPRQTWFAPAAGFYIVTSGDRSCKITIAE